MTTIDIKGFLKSRIQNLAGFLEYWTKKEALMAEVHKERQQLIGLDDRLLKDIGISRDEAVFEAQRYDWDVSERRLHASDHRLNNPTASDPSRSALHRDLKSC